MEALQSDLADVQGGTTAEGIHLGAMAGTVDIVFRHYAGVDLTGDVIAFHPRLPEALRRLRLRVRHRGRWYEVTVTHERFALEVEAGPPGPVRVKVFDEEPGSSSPATTTRRRSRASPRSGLRPPGGRSDGCVPYWGVLATPHLSVPRNRPMSETSPDLRLLEDVVAPRVLGAMRTASRALASLGVRHAVAGGLAVGAHGYPRNTQDVDLLVGNEAFERHEGGLVTLKPGVPIEVDGVAVDLLSTGDKEAFLDQSLAQPLPGEVPVVPAGTLVYLKLKSPRLKDRADVVEFVKAGLALQSVRQYLERFAPPLVARFEECIAQARAEEE